MLAKSQRNGILTAPQADEFLATLNKLPITVDPDSSEHILTDVLRLVVAYQLTAYDASYLEVALRMDLPLATLDDELIVASKASGVELL